MLEVRRLRTLREVGLRGSFSAAAAAMHYTQAAVSQQIALLEQEAGMLLVDRTVRPLRLTDAGATLVAHTETVLGELAAAEADLAAVRSLEAGRLRIGFFASAGATIVAPAVLAFSRAHPKIELSVSEGTSGILEALVRAGDLDVAVVTSYPALGETLDQALAIHHLADDEFTLVVPHGHCLTRRKCVALGMLAKERFIFPTPLGPVAAAYTRLLESACARAGFTPTVAFHITDCQTAQAFVADGHGIAILPELALHPLNANVEAHPLKDAPPPRHIVAVHRAGMLSAAAQAFIELLAPWRKHSRTCKGRE